MSIIVAALLGFVILSCFASSKSLIAVVALAVLFYFFKMKGVTPCTSTTC